MADLQDEEQSPVGVNWLAEMEAHRRALKAILAQFEYLSAGGQASSGIVIPLSGRFPVTASEAVENPVPADETLTMEQEAEILQAFDVLGDGLSGISDRLDSIHALLEDNLRDVREAGDVLRQSNAFAIARRQEENPVR